MDIGVSVYHDHEYARRIAQLEHHFDMKRKLDAKIIEHLAAEKRNLYLKLGEYKNMTKVVYEDVHAFLSGKLNEKGYDPRNILMDFELNFKEKMMGSDLLGGINPTPYPPYHPTRARSQMIGLNADKNSDVTTDNSQFGRPTSIPRGMGRFVKDEDHETLKSRISSLLEKSKTPKRPVLESEVGKQVSSVSPVRQFTSSKVQKAFDMRGGRTRKRTRTPEKEQGEKKEKSGEDDLSEYSYKRGEKEFVTKDSVVKTNHVNFEDNSKFEASPQQPKTSQQYTSKYSYGYSRQAMEPMTNYSSREKVGEDSVEVNPPFGSGDIVNNIRAENQPFSGGMNRQSSNFVRTENRYTSEMRTSN